MGFHRRRKPACGAFAKWLAISATLLSCAALELLLAPRSSLAWIGLPEVLGVLGVLALAIGAVREFQSTRRADCELARVDERRRLARELHDHVAQELAFILGQSRELERMFPDQRALADIGAAAQQALNGSRSTIYGLQQPSTPPSLGQALRVRAEILARRAGLELALVIDDDIVAAAEVEHAVLSIAQEAISNAVRHGAATMLEVSLIGRGEALVLRISDNGCGFEVQWRAPSEHGGLGMWSMLERAQALGGRLQLSSQPGDGTTIELTFALGLRARAGIHPGKAVRAVQGCSGRAARCSGHTSHPSRRARLGG